MRSDGGESSQVGFESNPYYNSLSLSCSMGVAQWFVLVCDDRGRYLSDQRLSKYEEQVRRSQELFAEDPYRQPEEYVVDIDEDEESVLYETGKKSDKKQKVGA